MRRLVRAIAQCLFQRHPAQGVVIFNLLLPPVCLWRDTTQTGGYGEEEAKAGATFKLKDA